MFIFINIATAGNLSLIEKRLEELNRLNKQAVQEAGPLPQYGSVDIKAKIPPGATIVKDMPGVKEKRFEFGQKTILALEQTMPFTVQISSSQSKAQCYRVANMLRRAGYPAFTASLKLKDKGIWHRIFVGSFPTREEAEKIKAALEEDEIKDGFIRSMPYAVQVGKTGTNDTLKELKEKVFSIQYLPYTGYIVDTDSKETMTRLLVGAFETRADTANLVNELRKNGIEARVVNR